MQLIKPKKTIVFYLDNILSEKQEKKIIGLFQDDLQENIDMPIFLEEKKVISICYEDIDELNKRYIAINNLLWKEKIKHKTLFKINASVEFQEENEAFDFMEQYSSKPFEDAECLCLSTKFVCSDSERIFLVSLEAVNTDSILVEIFDWIEKNGDVKNKYNDALTILHKVIKY